MGGMARKAGTSREATKPTPWRGPPGSRQAPPMARPRKFDEATALDAAIECFWRRGYEATSLRDLTVSMGLTAPSLYNAFGDEEELFALALERYLDRNTRSRLH